MESTSQECEDGTSSWFCPEGTLCEYGGHRCVKQEAVDACGGQLTGPCTLPDGSEGTCDSGVCIVKSVSCGDGQKDHNEECDGLDLAGRDCASFEGFDSGVLACTSDCRFDTSGCVSNPDCGNAVAEPEKGEECDGTDLNGQTCTTQGFDTGTLACTSGCAFDTSGCVSYNCGNGQRDPDEECEGSDLNGETCTSLNFDGGTLGCTNCQFDTSSCYRCGDGVVNGFEQCDLSDLGGNTCTSQGYDGGSLSCTGACTLDTSDCYECGDGVVNGSEQCDLSDLDGESCATRGYAGGSLACTSSCTFDLSGCYRVELYGLSMNQWTQAVLNTDCDCNTDDTCRALYQGQVTAINGNTATMRFQKVGGGGPTVDVRYWISLTDQPVCDGLDNYAERKTGWWQTSDPVPFQLDVNIWPTVGDLDSAPCGEQKPMFIITGGVGYEQTKLWFQYDPVVFRKVCN